MPVERTTAGGVRRAVRAGSAATAVLAALLSLRTDPVLAQTLPEASAAALENSFTLRADRARQDGAEARVNGAYDAFLPSVAFTVDQPIWSRIDYYPQAAATRVGLEGPDSIPRHDPTNLGLTANLQIFDGLKRWHVLNSARTLAESGRFLSIGKRQQVLLDTAVAYIAVLRDTRIVAAREAQIQAIRRIRDVTERQYEVNDATRTDVALTRSRVQEAEASRDRALAELAASRREFIRLTRMEPERMVPPRFPDTLPRDETAYAELVRQANPSIAAANLDARAAVDQARAVESELLPTVNLQFSKFAQYGYSEAIHRIDDTTTRILARVPIYEPGTFPRISEASALARQRGYEAQDNELATVTAARTAFARRRIIADQLVRLTDRVAQLRETMNGFQVERGAGFRTILDELNIRAELADAEVAAAIVLTERDGQSLQLAAAAALLDVGTSVPAARRFEALAPIQPMPRLVLRHLADDDAPLTGPPVRTATKVPARAVPPALGGAGAVAASTAKKTPVVRVSQAEPAVPAGNGGKPQPSSSPAIERPAHP